MPGPICLLKPIAMFVATFIALSVPWFCANADDDANQSPLDLDIQQLKNVSVRSIDFFETSLDRAPNNLTVLSHRDLRTRPHNTIEEHIQYGVLGSSMIRHGINGPNFAARGATRGGGQKTLALWNGRALNNRTSEGYQMGYLSPFFGDLEQIEVVLGPGSLVHGTGAFHGYVNYVPKTGEDHQGQDTQLSLGLRDGLFRLQNGFGKHYGEDRSLFIYGGFAVADGFKFNNDYGAGFKQTEKDGQGIVGDYLPSYRFSSNWIHDRFQFTSLFERIVVDPKTLFLSNSRSPLLEKHLFSLQPRYTYDLSNTTSLEIAPSILYQDQSVKHIARNRSDANIVPEIEDGGSESSGQLRMTVQSTRWKQHNLTIGGIAERRSVRPKKQFFSNDAETDAQHVQGHWHEYALFLEDTIDVGENLVASLGIRYDRTNYNLLSGKTSGAPGLKFTPDNLSNFTPRLNLNYRVDDGQYLKFSYQEGFQYAPVETYPRIVALNRFLHSINEEPFRSLQPDEIESIELGYSGDFLNDKVGIDFSLYHNTFKDPLVFRNLFNEPIFVSQDILNVLPQELATVVFNAGGSFTTKGGEINLRWNPKTGTRLSLGYSYAVPGRRSGISDGVLNTTNEAGSEYLIYPKHQIKSSVDLSWNRWSLTTSLLYESGVDKRRPPSDSNVFSDAHFRVNSHLQFHHSDELSLGFSIHNLFGNVTPSSNTNTEPWFGTLGSDERLFYATVQWRPRKH